MWSLLTFCVIVASAQAAPPTVSLYYESLCPHSIRFIVKQLTPTYQELGNYFTLDFIPFGFAEITNDPWNITCQHGPRECAGNIITNCMLTRLNSNKDQVNYVGCVEADSAPDTAGEKCAKQLNLSYDGVEDCSEGTEGHKLIEQAGERTKSFTPEIIGVPTIVFNGVYNDKDQNQAQVDFKSVVCKYLGTQQPEACNDSINISQ